jgi:hypothetical protein
MGEGSASIGLLAVILILSSLLFLYQIIVSKKIIIHKSFFIIMTFFLYVVFRIVIDTQSIDMLQSFMLSTSGGIFLFFVLATLFSLSISYISRLIINSIQLYRVTVFMFLIFILLQTYFIIDTYLLLLQDMRADIFLLNKASDYQRPANFLSMEFMLTSAFFVNLIVTSIIYKSKFIIRLISSIFYINILLSILMAQLFGSNNATILLFCIMILLITFQILLKQKRVITILTSYSIQIRSLFIGVISNKIYKSIFTMVLILLLLSAIFINNSDIDINSFRMFGFGSGELSSVSSRIKLWDNFMVQFAVSPLFGNIIVDSITTGSGSYVHSMIASILTHLGFFGFFIFIFYIYYAVKELFQIKFNLFFENGVHIFYFLLFIGIFMIAVAGTFFVWTPIWFLFGLLFPSLTLITYSRRK